MHGGFARSAIGLRAAASARRSEMERDPSNSFKMNSEQRRNYSPGYHCLTQAFGSTETATLSTRPRSPWLSPQRGWVISRSVNHEWACCLNSSTWCELVPRSLC